jgi:hypothetical protein
MTAALAAPDKTAHPVHAADPPHKQPLSPAGPETSPRWCADGHAQHEPSGPGELAGAYGVARQVNAKTARVADAAPVATGWPCAQAKECLGAT